MHGIISLAGFHSELSLLAGSIKSIMHRGVTLVETPTHGTDRLNFGRDKELPSKHHHLSI